MTTNQTRQAAQGSGKPASNDRNFIDLHVRGLGYLSRVREVKVRKGPPFLAASLRAMSGEKGVQDGVQYTPFDVKAVSSQAKEVLELLQPYANDRNKRVMVSFKAGDPMIDTFTYKDGDRAGQMGTVLKARLLLIYGAWVKSVGDGNDQQGWAQVYELPPQAEATSSQPVAARGTGTDGMPSQPAVSANTGHGGGFDDMDDDIPY